MWMFLIGYAVVMVLLGVRLGGLVGIGLSVFADGEPHHPLASGQGRRKLV